MKNKTPTPTVQFSPEMQQQAADLVREAIQLLTEQTKKMAQQVTEFEMKRQRTREKVHGSIRRTRRRLV